MILARIFLQIGATSFGGLGSALAVIERELVHRRPIVTAVEVTEAVAATRVLPGSTLIQVASFLGYRIRGWKGSAIAVVACVVPGSLAMLAVAALFPAVPLHPAFESAARGVAPTVVGLLLAGMCRLGRSSLGSPLALGVALAAFGSATALRVPAAMVVVAAGLIGIRWLGAPESGRGRGSRQGQRS
jgi:chromate transporter